MASFIITTRYDGGKYLAEINAKVVNFSCLSAHKAAQKAAGENFTVKEIKPHVYRAEPKKYEHPE